MRIQYTCISSRSPIKDFHRVPLSSSAAAAGRRRRLSPDPPGVRRGKLYKESRAPRCGCVCTRRGHAERASRPKSAALSSSAERSWLEVERGCASAFGGGGRLLGVVSRFLAGWLTVYRCVRWFDILLIGAACWFNKDWSYVWRVGLLGNYFSMGRYELIY